MHTDQAAAATPLMSEEEVGRRVVPVIVGGTFLAYAYVREFNRRYGTTRCIVIITQNVKMLTSSKFTDCRIVPDAAHPEGLYRALEDIASELRAEDPETVPLLLGCDDRHALMFAAAQEHLRDEGFVVACNNYTMLAKISQKRGFYELCEELDIPYPKTWYFSCGENGPETLPVDEFPYPCIAKPSDTTKFQNANVAHKRKAYEIDSPEELSSVWRDVRASEYDGEFVIQDFIPGGDEALRILNTFSTPDGDLRVVSGGITVLQDHSPSALGNPLCILGDKDPQVIDHARTFLKKVGYQGYGNFDLKYDSRTGKCVFFEINVRAGRSTYFTSLAGVNFVTLVVDQYILGKEVPAAEAYEPFVYCCVPPYVLKRSVTDKSLLRKTLATLELTPDAYPLVYEKDTWRHNFWAWVMYFNQIRKFKRYFWDTQGKQLK